MVRRVARMEHVNVLIIGAGVSGIGAACHLRRNNPDHDFTILEGRESLGGTWDLFRYPGIRSDSDMYTYAFSFKPWIQDRDIATGDAILAYLEETVDEYDLRDSIRFGHRVERVSWSSERRRWTATVIRIADDHRFEMTSDFLLSCTGYYDYERGHLPEFAGLDDFRGVVAHPQHWPRELDYSGKRVVVIGSGATAVTVVPAMAEGGADVTMLQRSPSYIYSRPGIDAIGLFLRRFLPTDLAYRLTRWKNIVVQRLYFYVMRWRPEWTRRKLRELTQQGVGPNIDANVHFSPRYAPWDQRLCLIPDDDLFESLRTGAARVVTDTIDHFDEAGIVLSSGDRLNADIVVPATGLELKFLGGIAMDVDGRPVDPGQLVTYRGVLFAGIPNWAAVFGYTSASWTLKADLVSGYVCRLLRYMRKHGFDVVVPQPDHRTTPDRPLMDSLASAGYIKRGGHRLPKQGTGPWTNSDDYPSDIRRIGFASFDDGILRFESKAVDTASAPLEAARS